MEAWLSFSQICLLLLSWRGIVEAFAPAAVVRPTTRLWADTAALEEYLNERCPMFYEIVLKMVRSSRLHSVIL